MLDRILDLTPSINHPFPLLTRILIHQFLFANQQRIRAIDEFANKLVGNYTPNLIIDAFIFYSNNKY
tara:strand:+ start:440 stop:640 length:201 start_codon:yes stop_codon:yes gene_type:complete